MVESTELNREQIETERREAESLVVTLEKDYQGLARTMERGKADATIDQILDWSKAISAKRGEIDKAQAVITNTQKRLDVVAYNEKSQALLALVMPIREAIGTFLTGEVAAECASLGVDVIHFTVDRGETGFSVSHKLTGEGVPRSVRAPRASGNGTGGRSQGKVSVGGIEYASANAAYRALRSVADGVDASTITPANGASVARWMEKNGLTMTAA